MNSFQTKYFIGFSPATLDFLRNLQKNNNKVWFEKNRSLYQKVLLKPLQELVLDLQDTISDIDPHIETRPLINRAISNIYRDIRFSRDKRLLKDRMWLVFKRPSKEWTERLPAFYFEINTESYLYGMGYYSASPSLMNALRKAILTNPAKFRKAIAFYKPPQNKLRLEGEYYKKPPVGDYPPDLKEWFNLKTFYFGCERKPDRLLFSRQLADELRNAFIQLAPLYQFLISLSLNSNQQ